MKLRCNKQANRNLKEIRVNNKLINHYNHIHHCTHHITPHHIPTRKICTHILLVFGTFAYRSSTAVQQDSGKLTPFTHSHVYTPLIALSLNSIFPKLEKPLEYSTNSLYFKISQVFHSRYKQLCPSYPSYHSQINCK